MLITPGSDNYENNANESDRFYQFWNSNSFGTTTSAGTTNFFDTAGSTVQNNLPSVRRFPGGWDVTVYRASLEAYTVNQTPATNLDLNALVAGSYIRFMRNSTEEISQIATSTLTGPIIDPGNAASNAQVAGFAGTGSSTYNLPSPFGQFEIPNSQFFHAEFIVSSDITLSAATVLKMVIWTRLRKPAS